MVEIVNKMKKEFMLPMSCEKMANRLNVFDRGGSWNYKEGTVVQSWSVMWRQKIYL